MTREQIERAAGITAIWIITILIWWMCFAMIRCNRAGAQGVVVGQAKTAMAIPGVPVRTGSASWYSEESCKREGTSGVWTASGEKFFDDCDTCAMRSRDFGKYYRVTNIRNNKSVVVRHNDFGPNRTLYEQGRIVDLSKGAFRKIANLRDGVVEVKIEEVER